MLRSPSRKTRRHAFDLNDHRHQQQPQQEAWPEDTIVVLPETPRVRLSPRRKMMPQTPGWPPATDMGETIRMYHDPEDQENETVDFTMNQEFVENMQSFIPSISPTNARMLSPSKRGFTQEPLEDNFIEIPESAGLSDVTREAIFNVWAREDSYEDSEFDDGVHYTRDCQAVQYTRRNAKLNQTIRYLVIQLQEKEKEIQRIPGLEKKLITLQTQLKSLALIPKTPMRTSSLKHTIDTTAKQSDGVLAPPQTPRSHHAKENVHQQMSPRKALQDLPTQTNAANSTLDSDIEAIESSKRALAALYAQNTSLQHRIQSLESLQTAAAADHNSKVSVLESELSALAEENHRLENELQISRAETSLAQISSPRGVSGELARLSEELAWHAKLHLYAERERMRLLDLLEFAGLEGKVVGKEVGVLREKLSILSLKSVDSGIKCLV